MCFFHARVSTNGQLSVSGNSLVDEKGMPVILKGISLHGLTWYPDFVDEDIFRQLSDEWDCNLIRLPLYYEVYCKNNSRDGLDILEKGISYAVWNFSNKNESSAMLLPTYTTDAPITDDALSACGKWIKLLIQGAEPDSIPIPELNDDGMKLPGWLSRSLSQRDLFVAGYWKTLALYVAIFILIVLFVFICVDSYVKKHYRTYDGVCKAAGRCSDNDRNKILKAL